MHWHRLLNICVLAMVALVLLVLPLARGVTADAGVGWFHAPIAAYLIPLIGLLMAPIYPVINSVALSSLPKPSHAAMTGLIVIFSALGGTLGSRITAMVFARFGGIHAFYFSLVPMTLVLVTLFFFKRETERAGALVPVARRPRLQIDHPRGAGSKRAHSARRSHAWAFGRALTPGRRLAHASPCRAHAALKPPTDPSFLLTATRGRFRQLLPELAGQRLSVHHDRDRAAPRATWPTWSPSWTTARTTSRGRPRSRAGPKSTTTPAAGRLAQPAHPAGPHDLQPTTAQTLDMHDGHPDHALPLLDHGRESPTCRW